MEHPTLTIGWLYPDLMSTYGDRGNVLVLSKLAAWNGVKLHVMPIDQMSTIKDIQQVDLVFGGGSQDIQQELVMKDLHGKKGETVKQLIEHNKPALFVCGSPQLMGNYYEPAVGRRIPGLGIFDMVTENPGLTAPRCIGNCIAKVNWSTLDPALSTTSIIVGFENHGGRTYLGKRTQPFAQVLYGFGNNATDKTEGVVYKNAIGSYFHGPLLPKNPDIAVFLLQKALSIKYKQHFTIKNTQDILADRAKTLIISRYLKR